MPSKTEYILATIICGKPQYVMALTTRTWDNRKLIIRTENIEEAYTWETKEEAILILERCVTNSFHYQVESYTHK